MSSFDSWLQSLGSITKYALFGSVGIAAVSTFSLVSAELFLLPREPRGFLQVWRPFTAALFFGNFSFQWLMSLSVFVSFMNYNEIHDFKNSTGRFAWFLGWLVATHCIIGYSLGFLVTSFSLSVSLCWTFCRRNANQPLSLYGFSFSAGMFPWVFCGLHVLIGQSIIPDLIGIAVGHAVLFMFDVFPPSHPLNFSTPPRWFLRLFNERVATIPSSSRNGAAAASAQRGEAARGAFPVPQAWAGAGRKLGSS